MLPVEQSERAHFLARIEVDILAVEDDYRDIVIELTEREVALIEDGPVAIDDLHGIHVQSRGARQGNIEKSEIVGRAALLRPHIFGVANLLKLFVFALRAGLLTREVGVIELHYLA